LQYWGLEQFDQGRSDWQIRYASVFQHSGTFSETISAATDRVLTRQAMSSSMPVRAGSFNSGSDLRAIERRGARPHRRRSFILCLGYKANVVKNYFLNYEQTATSDCVISDFGKRVGILGEPSPDWRVALVDTGTWRNIGERLVAVRHLVEDEEIFLANYSDGLTDAPLIDRFKRSDIHWLEDHGARAQAPSTFFLRNRPQLELIRRVIEQRAKTDALRVAVLGCSIGVEHSLLHH
jgi:hypothetical protein